MRYLITGGSGYIGSRLVELLARREDTEKIVIADVVPPKGAYRPKTEFEKVDVRDRPAVHAALERANPDVLVHLAFILNPVHDEGLMYDVDVNGTHNVLEAAAEVGVDQVLVTTSGVAYGAFPDNPEPITEDWPVRGVARFSYARDKTESDRIVQLWALQHPDVITTIVRPCIVFGPNVDNYLVRIWSEAPAIADVGNLDSHAQFVHEDDVVEAISRLLLGKHAGAVQPRGRRPDDAPRVRRAAGRAGDQDAGVALPRAGEARLARAAVGGAGRRHRLRALPLDPVEREGEEDARLDPALRLPRDLPDRDASTGEAARRRARRADGELERSGDRDAFRRGLNGATFRTRARARAYQPFVGEHEMASAVRHSIDGWNRDDFDACVSIAHPDIEWTSAIAEKFAGHACYRGLRGLRRLLGRVA